MVPAVFDSFGLSLLSLNDPHDDRHDQHQAEERTQGAMPHNDDEGEEEEDCPGVRASLRFLA